jgi:hypothetical protein
MRRPLRYLRLEAPAAEAVEPKVPAIVANIAAILANVAAVVADLHAVMADIPAVGERCLGLSRNSGEEEANGE